MSDAAVAVPAPKATPKKVKTAKAKPAKTSSHPSYQDMIKKAVETLKERNGSSRQAIQKYIQTTFKTCDDKVSQAHLKLALKRGVDSGFLKRVKGTGASGSFRLNAVEKKLAAKKPASGASEKLSNGLTKKASSGLTKKPKAAGEKKVKVAKSAKTAVKPSAAKTAKPKKTVAEKKATAKPKVARKPKTPKKAVAKPAAKPAAKKATTPKVKKAPAAKKAVVKK